MRRAAVEGILNKLADDFRTRRKMPQVARWSRHRLATARHFAILEHRNLSDNCSRSGGNDQVRHSLIIHTHTAQVERQDTSQYSSIATFRTIALGAEATTRLSDTLSSFIYAQKLASAPLLPPLYLRSSPFHSPSHLHRPVVVP